jgi:hypothetical protein
MRSLVVVLLAMGLAACADTDVKRDGDGYGYELILPADVISSRPGLWEEAADESAILCPNGFRVASAADMPSDVDWQIRCLQKITVVQ